MESIRLLKEIPEIELKDRKLGPFAAGEEAQVRPWEAGVLERRGIAERVDAFGVVEVRKRIIGEKKSSNLKDIPMGFYQGVLQQIKNLQIEEKFEEIRKLSSALNSLFETRAQKIVRLLLSSAEIGDLPPEEELFANRVLTVVEQWKADLNHLNGSKRVGRDSDDG